MTPLNSNHINRLIEVKQAWLESLNPTVQRMVWDERNDQMFKNIKDIVRRNPGKRILITAGAEHNYVFLKALQREAWQIRFPLA